MSEIDPLGKDCCNIITNIPAVSRDWVMAEMPPELFGALVRFYDARTVKEKIEFYRKNPDKCFWKLNKE